MKQRDTLHAAVTRARQRLIAAGIPSDEAELDARLLAQEVLGWDAARFLANTTEPVPDGFAAACQALVTRRAAREPLAYIVGRREFWNLSFEVTPAVLIPRPETELLVEAALERLQPGESARVADVCTGSGCIAVALAHERRAIEVTAVDLSSDALSVAERNATRHRVASRVHFARSDLLSTAAGMFDLIVCNPPYVPATDYAALQPEVRVHEPREALVAGPDGLDVIRRLVREAPGRLVPGGALLFEFGFNQADDVSRLISSERGLTMDGLRRDLQGIPRLAIAHRRRESIDG